MATPTTFQRYELKFLITDSQRSLLEGLTSQIMTADKYGASTICNVYYDTPDHLLIRRSMEKPVYKEKLRLRSYGPATPDSQVYLELKKKCKGVVYKRRAALPLRYASNWLDEKEPPVCTTQILREIEYFRSLYPGLCPAVHLSYQREAFFGKDDNALRMTFDRAILWRDYDLSLSQGAYGEALLPQGCQLLEVKTAYGLPLWLASFLSRQGIYKASFSKYGNAYKAMEQQKGKGVRRSA